MRKYKLAATGGTFDRFHKGHKALLTHALDKAGKIIVGITNKKLSEAKYLSNIIEEYEIRKKSVLDYAKELKREKDIKIIRLDDIYGPTLTNPVVDVLVCSPMTKTGAETINRERSKRGLEKLPIKICKMAKATDGAHISSTRVRNGEINREGFVYAELFSENIELTEQQRKILKKPIGRLLSRSIKVNLIKLIRNKLIVVPVGDVISKFYLENGLKFDFCVFDNKSERKDVSVSLLEQFSQDNIIKSTNNAGNIEKGVFSTLKKALSEKKSVFIEGEEDLVVLPMIMILPLESLVLYGQPKEGVVVVEITEERKEWCRELLE
jgi:cytidyltransferase-like protein